MTIETMATNWTTLVVNYEFLLAMYLIVYIFTICQSWYSFHFLNVGTLCLLIEVLAQDPENRHEIIWCCLTSVIILYSYIKWRKNFREDIFASVFSTALILLTVYHSRDESVLMAINLFHIFYLLLLNYFHSEEKLAESDDSSDGQSARWKSVQTVLIIIMIFMFCSIMNSEMLFWEENIHDAKRVAHCVFWLVNLLIIEFCKLFYAYFVKPEVDEEFDYDDLDEIVCKLGPEQAV